MIYEFSASRLSKDNKIFPDKFVIDTMAKTLTLNKKRIIGYDQILVKAEKITTVTIHSRNELLFLSEVVIGTNAGEIRANGFSSKDAMEIKRLVEGMM